MRCNVRPYDVTPDVDNKKFPISPVTLVELHYDLAWFIWKFTQNLKENNACLYFSVRQWVQANVHNQPPVFFINTLKLSSPTIWFKM